MTRTTEARQREDIVNAYRRNTMTFADAVKALVSAGLDEDNATWLLGQATKLDQRK